MPTFTGMSKGVRFLLALFCLTGHGACRSQDPGSGLESPPAGSVPGLLGRTGSASDARPAGLAGGLLLAGGGTDVDEAMSWFLAQARGGDIVILRASGSTGYNAYLYGMGGVHSVETLRINSRALADSDSLAARVRRAEGVFLAGGNQADYIRFWKDTRLHDALRWLAVEKKAVFGGTSAGCAVLGEFVFGALQGGVTSAEALANPFDERVSLETGFLAFPELTGVITDQHYTERDRHGRHAVFLARLKAVHPDRALYGIGVDERTAVAIDGAGRSRVFGSGSAWFLEAGQAAEVLSSGTPLSWSRDGRALSVYRISGSPAGNGRFDLLPHFGAVRDGGVSLSWRVVQGVLQAGS